MKGVNIPPKSPFGGAGIYRTQRTKVCRVLQVPVLMNKWKCSVMSVVIVSCKWCSRGACKQFLVSRKHCSWEIVYNTNLLLQLSLHGLYREAVGSFMRESWQFLTCCLQSQQRWLMGAQTAFGRGSTLREMFLFSFFSALFLVQAGRVGWYLMESIFGYG